MATRISLCLIVRNEEAHLAACLQSARDLVQEIIVVDTGSTDRTKEVAAQLGARVLDFPWCDDFAAARNESLRHATGDWIFWLDADERLDQANRQKLRTLFANLPNANVAYTMTQRSELEASTYSAAQVDHVRLFRNHPQIRWQYRVHEQILGAVRRSGGELRRTDVVIEHAGFHDPTCQEAKVERNLRLLEREAAEHPNDAFVLFNLGSVHLGRGRGAVALPYLRRSLELSHPTDTLVPKLYALLARAHHQLGQPIEALMACRSGRAYFPADAELLFWEGVLLKEQGNFPAAVACLLQVLDTKPDTCFTGADAGMRSYKARHGLAEIYRAAGRLDEAVAQWRLVLAERPDFAPARLALAELFRAQGRWAEADQVLVSLQNDPQAQVTAAVGQAEGQLARRELAAARQTLEAVITQAPQALRPRILLTYVLLQDGRDWAAAEKALREVLKLDPKQTECWRNLAVLLRQQGWTAEAWAACQAGLFHGGEDDELLLLQGMLLLDRGDPRGAEPCFARVLKKQAAAPDPSDPRRQRRSTARHHLALACRAQQRDAEAEALWNAVVAEQPTWLPAWKELGDLFLAQRRWADLQRILRQLECLPDQGAEASMLRVRAQLARREFVEARRLLEGLIAQAPHALWPRLALSYAYLQEGLDWDAAERALRAVLELDPGHAEARHNLALLLQQQKPPLAG
jgi:tetratricopeptide (TPR) repeat protein